MQLDTVHRAGFSLLETLIALVIMSITSLALFQSIGTMLRISDKAVRVGERALENAIERQSLQNLINGLVPHWEEYKSDAFVGAKNEFSGLSSDGLISEIRTLTPFKVRLLNVNEQGLSLVYEAADQQVIFIEKAPSPAEFQYMGIDQKWYSHWPLETAPTRGFFDITNLIPNPALPEAIRLWDNAGHTYWVMPISKYKHLPYRSDILLEN